MAFALLLSYWQTKSYTKQNTLVFSFCAFSFLLNALHTTAPDDDDNKRREREIEDEYAAQNLVSHVDELIHPGCTKPCAITAYHPPWQIKLFQLIPVSCSIQFFFFSKHRTGECICENAKKTVYPTTPGANSKAHKMLRRLKKEQGFGLVGNTSEKAHEKATEVVKSI